MKFRWPWHRTATDTQVNRWLVVDVESTGLDPYTDRLLAIAGVAVRFDGGRLYLEPADSFEVVLQQDNPTDDKSNILIHGIGVAAQRNGMAPAQALLAFENWATDAVLVAFHAPFDEAMIQRAMTKFLRRKLAHRWLDLAYLAPLALPAEKAKSLDEWLDLRGIRCAVRHQAVADAWATAQLLQSIWPALQLQGEPLDAANLHRRAEQLRWLTRGR
jgi:DNA polymerase III subunit epsilon